MTPTLSSHEVAELLQCTQRTAEDWARSGKLPAMKFGDSWVYPTQALIEAVNQLAKDESVKRSRPNRPVAVKIEPKGRPNLTQLIVGSNPRP